jgi:cysteine-rich repeat protein
MDACIADASDLGFARFTELNQCLAGATAPGAPCAPEAGNPEPECTHLFCGPQQTACFPSAQSCCEAGLLGGCDTAECGECVCDAAPFCCVAWDASCVEMSISNCNGLCLCASLATCSEINDCRAACQENAVPGVNCDTFCESSASLEALSDQNEFIICSTTHCSEYSPGQPEYVECMKDHCPAILLTCYPELTPEPVNPQELTCEELGECVGFCEGVAAPGNPCFDECTANTPLEAISLLLDVNNCGSAACQNSSAPDCIEVSCPEEWAACFPPLPGDCCAPGTLANCQSPYCSACVCETDDVCCSTLWDETCVAATTADQCATLCGCSAPLAIECAELSACLDTCPIDSTLCAQACHAKSHVIFSDQLTEYATCMETHCAPLAGTPDLYSTCEVTTCGLEFFACHGGAPICGNDILEVTEECDDGNNNELDGCSPTCTEEIFTGIPIGALVVTEIMQNPSAVSDSKGEWLEIYNTTGTDIDLNGVIVRDNGANTHTITEAVIVNAGGFVVLGRNEDPALNGGYQPDYVYVDFTLGNSDDEVILESEGVIVSAVFYDGGAVFPDPTGKSMQLALSAHNAVAAQQGANWCEGFTPYGLGDLGTPGAPNTGCPGIDSPP